MNSTLQVPVFGQGPCWPLLSESVTNQELSLRLQCSDPTHPGPFFTLCSHSNFSCGHLLHLEGLSWKSGGGCVGKLCLFAQVELPT